MLAAAAVHSAGSDSNFQPPSSTVAKKAGKPSAHHRTPSGFTFISMADEPRTPVDMAQDVVAIDGPSELSGLRYFLSMRRPSQFILSSLNSLTWIFPTCAGELPSSSHLGRHAALSDQISTPLHSRLPPGVASLVADTPSRFLAKASDKVATSFDNLASK